MVSDNPEPMTYAEMVVTERAIRQRWVTTPDEKRAIKGAILATLKAAMDKGKMRETLRACHMFVMLEAQNQSDEHAELKAREPGPPPKVEIRFVEGSTIPERLRQ